MSSNTRVYKVNSLILAIELASIWYFDKDASYSFEVEFIVYQFSLKCSVCRYVPTLEFNNLLEQHGWLV